jgi:hypothetical protein
VLVAGVAPNMLGAAAAAELAPHWKAGWEAAGTMAPKAGWEAAPNAGVGAAAPNAGCEAAPNAGCEAPNALVDAALKPKAAEEAAAGALPKLNADDVPVMTCTSAYVTVIHASMLYLLRVVQQSLQS